MRGSVPMPPLGHPPEILPYEADSIQRMFDTTDPKAGRKRSPKPLKRILALGAAAFLAACSGGGSSDGASTAGAFQIVSCSLSCGGGTGGTQISCGLNQVAVNEAIVIDFNQPIDLSTVNKNTFQLINIATGKAPSGTFSISPSNDKRLIFRPGLTFDASGSPVFGFDQQQSYQVLVRGTAQDAGGNFIRSEGGKANLSRLFCTITAAGIQDPVPGPPTAVSTVTAVTERDPVTGDPTETEVQPLKLGTTVDDVLSQSQLKISFGDIMNPATLVNPITGTSPSIKVNIDPDGNTLDSGDQVPIFGTFTINLDQTNLQTTVLFTPSGGWPSSGSGALPRKVVVTLPPTILDLGGNPIANPGKYSFVPEFIEFDSVLLPDGGEDFSTTFLRDDAKSGALWGGGNLLRAKGGGSGELGPLRVTVDNSPFVLDTDNTTFSNNAILPSGPTDPAPGVTPSKTVTDGIFEFASLVVEPGAQIRIQGSQPARIFVRGEANIQAAGVVDLRGSRPPSALTSPPGHDSQDLSGGVGGAGGPGGGDGGQGADRYDDTDLSLILLGGVSNPGAVNDGREGEGVAGTSLAGGNGGSRWPTDHPDTSSDISMFVLDIVCKIDMVAGPGGGGGYATSGLPGTPMIVDAGLNPVTAGLLAPPTPGGDSAEVGLTAAERSLDPNLGFLRGGSGGGGGGMQYLRSTVNGLGFPVCVNATALKDYYTHSGAGGGGGGGALQLHAGATIRIDGTILATGGDGGSNEGGTLTAVISGQASPGGGGSGGAVLLQAPSIQIAQVAGRVSVDRGRGGLGPGGPMGSNGGGGGYGLIRLDSDIAISPDSISSSLLPYDPAPGSASGGQSSAAILTTGVLTQGLTGPEGRSGAQSCWIIPDGNFFVLTFAEDDFSDPLDPDLAWDMDVILTLPGFEPFSFRDVNDPDNPLGVTPESLLGIDFEGPSASVVAVRFQGAHFNKEVDDVCNVDLTGLSGEIDPDSVTPWLRSPTALNTYWETVPGVTPETASKRRPNMFRYQVVFDGNAAFSNLFAGITNLYVKGTPD